jgi:prolyl 4-hydroxylase
MSNEPNPTQDDALASLRAEAASADPAKVYALATALVARMAMEEAFPLFSQAAAAGHNRARIEAARMLLYGVGTASNPAQGVRLLDEAETAGNVIAAYLLAMISVGNQAVKRDARINQRLLLAVNAGYAPALTAAAIHFGRRNDEQDQALCMDLLRQAAGVGDPVAAQLLAARMQAAAADGQTPAMGAGSTFDPLPACSVHPFALGLVRERLALEETWQQPPVKRLSDRPKLGGIDSLLSADECRLLMIAARPRLSHSHTLDPQTGAKSFNSIRTSQDASFDPLQEDLALRLVQARMATAAGVELVFAEPLIVLRYAPGEQYHPHRDYLPSAALAGNRPQAGDRAGTICAYLNDVEAGGETVFPAAGVTIAPTAGSAIAFANLLPDGSPDPDSLHAGLPVERGEKWLATLWIRQGPYRDF